MTTNLMSALLAFALIGCNLETDGNADAALRIVQEFKPAKSGGSIVEQVKAAGASEEWMAIKTNESLYRVICKINVSGSQKELVFGVNINKKEVMALNRDALPYTNPS